MNRRSFFGTLAAIAATAVLPQKAMRTIPRGTLKAITRYGTIAQCAEYQRAYNQALSAHMEVIRLAPKGQWVVAT